VYRLAWAEQHGVPVESVTAAFVYVRTGEVVRPANLPDRAALERLLTQEDALQDGTGERTAQVNRA
jgi:DNA helicase-2/ATP-dependent DNA helicase PcrA